MQIQELSKRIYSLRDDIEALMYAVGYTDTAPPDAISPDYVEWDIHDPEQMLLVNQYSQIINNLVGIKRLLDYLEAPAGEPEQLFRRGWNYCSRLKVYHTGDRVEWLREYEEDGEHLKEWCLSNVAYNGKYFYLLGSREKQLLDGLTIRERKEQRP